MKCKSWTSSANTVSPTAPAAWYRGTVKAATSCQSPASSATLMVSIKASSVASIGSPLRKIRHNGKRQAPFLTEQRDLLLQPRKLLIEPFLLRHDVLVQRLVDSCFLRVPVL